MTEKNTGTKKISKRSMTYLISGIVGLVLIAVMFSIVFDPGRQSSRMDALNPSVFHQDGLALTLTSSEDEVRVSVDSVPREQLLDEVTGQNWTNSIALLPDDSQPVSPLFSITMNPESVLQVEMPVPNGITSERLVDLYEWDDESGIWQFLPSRFDPITQTFKSAITHSIDGLILIERTSSNPSAGVIVSPGGPDLGPDYGLAVAEGMFVDETGALTGSPTQISGSTTLLLVKNRLGGLNNYEDDLALSLLSLLIDQCQDYDGLILDFDGHPGYLSFVTHLSSELAAEGKMLEILIKADAMSGNYDITNLASVVNRIWVDVGDDPLAFLPGGDAERVLSLVIGLADRSRLGLVTSVYHVDVSVEGVKPVSFSEALSVFGEPDVIDGYLSQENTVLGGGQLPVRLTGAVESMGFDESLGMNYITYTEEDGIHYLYFSSPQNVSRKLEWARTYGLRSVLVRGLAHPDSPLNSKDGLSGFLGGQTLPDPARLGLGWEAIDQDGQRISEDEGDLSLVQYLWSVPTEEGSYTLSAFLYDSEKHTLGDVSVTIAGSIPTPTAVGTPIIVQTPGAPTSVPITGGIVIGNFELGGQTHELTAPDWMRVAGMTWVKFQVKWSPGDDPSNVAWRIQKAHANGFKVLLAIPGHPYPSAIDFSAYVNFVRGVAALGPDAIEIWNEQNLPIEWPLATISGETYTTQMLAPAYQAIKEMNPNVTVISGAPAPTGIYGPYGCGELGCGDLLILSQMRDAGAANYLDCVGVHYNEGIISPTQNSGDPRGDDYYTRYFSGMLNTYYGTLGKPVCFTELGYLSPQGYGSLPGSFSWAQNTTVAQQAQWLAEAAILSSQSGKVRLMIVWNVDIFHWSGTDPQGGYAIIRPDRSCPACETLGAAISG